jgi:hypothetical protein
MTSQYCRYRTVLVHQMPWINIFNIALIYPLIANAEFLFLSKEYFIRTN